MRIPKVITWGLPLDTFGASACCWRLPQLLADRSYDLVIRRGCATAHGHTSHCRPCLAPAISRMHSPTDNAGFKRPPRAPLYGYRWLHCHRHHWRRQFLSTLLPVFSDWHPNITVAALLLPAKLRYRGSQGLRLPSRVRNQRFEDKEVVLAAVKQDEELTVEMVNGLWLKLGSFTWAVSMWGIC